MVSLRSGTGTRPGGRGGTRWGLFTAIMALPALRLVLLAALAVKVMTADPDYPLGGGPEKVPCAEALAFGGARLPHGAHDGHCTLRAWQETDYEAWFRLPRDDVRAWLRATYPGAPAPDTEFCGDGVDLCLDLDRTGLGPGAQANAVQIDVRYKGPGTALVQFSAFTV
ncbi:hypothetical protein [Streptomyces sp. V3I7]|uniref:hypothetical protein n=1 Tax=Streptomyces sp. V3I7 TaxID=3042278 RepID=UPI0027891217|nr:hypothetical protein [Streptomyces sp. V3I7]MDQ0992051.1 hypothetical protein [Streptomyces sp. V3I7]